MFQKLWEEKKNRKLLDPDSNNTERGFKKKQREAKENMTS